MTTAVNQQKRIWTEADLESLPDDGYNHEVVNGRLVMSPKNNPEHGEICARLLAALYQFARDHHLGAVWDSSTGFWMRNENCRAPDISFLSKERLRGFNRRAGKFFRGAPDLAIEVLTPHSTKKEITERLNDYFDSGTQIAWVINPKTRSVDVYTAPEKKTRLTGSDILDDANLLPGFSLPIAELFSDPNWET